MEIKPKTIIKDYNLIEKYCDIKKNAVYAKEDCIIKIADEDFSNLEEEMISADETDDVVGGVSIPGSIEIEFGNVSVEIYLPYNINIIVHDSSRAKEVTTYFYEKGDMIFCAYTKSNATDITQVDKLFNNSVKYLSGKIDKHLLEIHNQILSARNIKMHHLETLLSQLYIVDTENGPIPLRQSSKEYAKEYAVSAKTSSHKLLSDAHGFDFGYAKDMISNALSSDQKNIQSDTDKIIKGNFEQHLEFKGYDKTGII